ncbi:DUF262 domain-containing protein [Rhizobium sp. SYY.PMSO]|uniref:DUF262 domain-containing protein n=1 Tax=Rhizobium sp. SYY.PMSO TaxID=3382192 RepID=UPI0039903571
MIDETELDEDLDIDAEDEDEEASHVAYDIATYPSDLTLSVIHEMWTNKEITIPSFQRNFVWNIKQSSLLIESFLLGLPVPQVFFYIDNENKNLVIDGQQRILSIIFFFEGLFGFENLQGRRQVFRLSGLAKDSPYYNKRYEDLSTSDQRRVKGSILRAVNIKQLTPAGQTTSMYHIFERLNTGGTPLRPQEIRNCVFAGGIVDVLQNLNKNPQWRTIIGKKTYERHQRDVEMLLRIFAIAEKGSAYEKPMKEFLNLQMRSHRKGDDNTTINFAEAFTAVTKLVAEKLPKKPFHVRGPINLAAMDSIMGVLIKHRSKIKPDLADRYKKLLADKGYQEAIYFNTSDAVTVKERLNLAKKYLID